MSPNVAASDQTPTQGSTASPLETPQSTESLFERVAWLYAFCRERVFRDDTDRIISALWQNQTPASGIHVVELGCGPGFYARKLAERFPHITVTGVDRSQRQLHWARERTNAVRNCSFERVNVLSLPFHAHSLYAVVDCAMFHFF